eukprot:scaffold561_cov162-Amphora_coffeaeformis.AAC.16
MAHISTFSIRSIAYFTMGLPVVLMFVFLGKALTLEGAEDGIEEYIGKWHVEVLREQGEVWSTAVSQIFFSIGITFGIMTAYGSYLPAGEPAFHNSVVVAVCNSLFSIISGFAVFASLGHLAYIEGEEVQNLNYGGFSLVFGTWPVVLGKLNGGIHWVRLLFFGKQLSPVVALFVEGFVTVARDTVAFQDTPKWLLSGVICLAAWLINLMYATDAGFVWLDVIAFAAGWIYGINEQFEKLGKLPVLLYLGTNFISVAAGCAVWFGSDTDNGSIWGGFVALVGTYLLGMATTKNANGDSKFGNYGDYRTEPYQILGVLTFVFAASLFTIGFVFPWAYEPFRLPEGHMGLDPEGTRAKEENGVQGKEMHDHSSDDDKADVEDVVGKVEPHHEA